jgi:hypothetical protein
LDAYAAREALPRVIELMGKELQWNSERKSQEAFNFENYLTQLPWIKSKKEKQHALAS